MMVLSTSVSISVSITFFYQIYGRGWNFASPQNESQKGLRHVEYIKVNQTCDKLR